MKSKYQEIVDFFVSHGKDESEIRMLGIYSSYLSMEICEYAHRDQKRVNGEDYANHPARCLNMYRYLVGIKEGKLGGIDIDLLYSYDVPFYGVQELCLLHDVIEDTTLTYEDLYDIFKENELDRYYRLYIDKPLHYLSHDKSVPYPIYIKECLKDPLSSLVKMLDLNDNLNTLTLDTLNSDNLKRCHEYLTYIDIINQKYHFIENINAYNKAYKASL